MVAQAGKATLIGRQLGHYAVVALLGRGATGTVYLAKDTALNRPVALKVLLGSLARSQDQVDRFLSEARAVAPLQHPHIVGVYEAGIRDGTPYIAMEYIEGETLERFLRRNGVLDWRHALYVAAQVIEALQCAHRQGLVHRDVKPANILLDRLGHVRLTDFGIARMQQDTLQRSQGYTCFGTPDYMSPEQCGSPSPIGPQSDFFSLGVMLYQMMTGIMPFTGQSAPALIQQIVNHTPPRLNRIRPEIPDDVARLVASLMEKSPDQRPAAGAVLRQEIERIQGQNGGASALPEALNAFMREMAEPASVRSDTPLPGERRPLRSPVRIRPERKRLAPISMGSQIAFLLLILFGILGAGFWHLSNREVRPEPTVAMDQEIITITTDREIWARLPGPHWLVNDIAWIGDQHAVVVSLRGREGTVLHGSQGLLSIDPLSGTMANLSAPVGPVLDAASGNGQTIPIHAGPLPSTPLAAPLANAIVVPFFVDHGAQTEARGLVQALAQRWDERMPAGRPLFEIDASELRRGDPANAWLTPGSEVPVAIHPDGNTLCLLLHDPDTQADYLVERDVRWDDARQRGIRLTTFADAIDPDSFRYSDTGQQLAYIRTLGASENSLWVMDLTQDSPNGIPVATGQVESYTFSPDGTHVAVTLRTDVGDDLILVDTATGKNVHALGPGHSDAGSWHPAGHQLFIQAFDEESGENQVWSVTTWPPYHRTRITSMAGGAQRAPVVSRDGRWIATVSERNGRRGIVFLRSNPGNATTEGGETAT